MEQDFDYVDSRVVAGKRGCVTLKKDKDNLIGVSIGGGSPYCPCLYVVQVFDRSPASKDGTLEAGDEILAVNGNPMKGKTKTDVAQIITETKDIVTIHYVKLHAEPKEGKTLDIVLKKFKHKLVESMTSETADALGMSRAVLCNDSLVKKLQELEQHASIYKGLVEHAKRFLQNFYDLANVHKQLGDAFAAIGVWELQANSCKAFGVFGDSHRQLNKSAIDFLKIVQPMLKDLNTFVSKAIPDTRLTVKKYLDAKFLYLSYCLKAKEMHDEEYSYAALREAPYRVETGNYEYRVVLRCRQLSRDRFAALRSDVLVKLELLDNKRVQDLVYQLQRFLEATTTFHTECEESLNKAHVFPIEVDLEGGMLKSSFDTRFEEDEDTSVDKP